MASDITAEVAAVGFQNIKDFLEEANLETHKKIENELNARTNVFNLRRRKANQSVNTNRVKSITMIPYFNVSVNLTKRAARENKKSTSPNQSKHWTTSTGQKDNV